MRITRLPVRGSRPPIRRSNLAYAPPSTAATSKTEIASSESIRRRARGRHPPPDTRTRAGALNVPDASPPNALVTGGAIGNRLPSRQSFCSFPTERPGVCRDTGNKDGASNRDTLETPKVSAPDISILRGVRPSTKQGPFPGTSWASTDDTTATLPDSPPYRTDMRSQNQCKAARRAERRSTRNHHRAIRMGRLEAMLHRNLE